jgi:anthraniloyl-CoA monooxygenase
MAHGYLLATFLSPLTNRRPDAYGGDVAGRLRFPLEVLRTVRGVWPARKPLSVRISATDWAEGGTTGADRLAMARALCAEGADIVDVSAGGTVPDQKPVYGRMYLVPFSEEIRLEGGVPTMTVGNVQDVDQANTILAAGRADLVALARAHLADPSLTLRAAAAYGVDVPWPSQYLAAKPARRKG